LRNLLLERPLFSAGRGGDHRLRYVQEKRHEPNFAAVKRCRLADDGGLLIRERIAQVGGEKPRGRNLAFHARLKASRKNCATSPDPPLCGWGFYPSSCRNEHDVAHRSPCSALRREKFTGEKTAQLTHWICRFTFLQVACSAHAHGCDELRTPFTLRKDVNIRRAQLCRVGCRRRCGRRRSHRR
jgi:hypothetical protein